MIRVLFKNDIHPWRRFLIWQREHPYGSSFLFSLIIVSYVLFSTPSLKIVEENTTAYDPLSFLDVEMMPSRELTAAKEVTVDPNATADENNIERATGTADWKSAVDTDFYPSMAPPRPVGRLKRLYPKLARDKNIEAVLNVDLLINEDGKVIDITIHRITLTTQVPQELTKKIRKDFAIYARKILVGAQFTPFIVNGKRKPARQGRRFEFRLKD